MRIAVLGLGFMGSTHLKALRNISGARLGAVYSSDERKLAGDLRSISGNIGGAGEQMDFEGVARYRDIAALLRDSTIDAVDICLPTHLHAPVAIEALRAGKHVLVEKPMALDQGAATAVIEEARRAGRILMAAQTLRFFPEYLALKSYLASSAAGAARHADFRRRCAAPAWGGWLADAEKSGGAVLDLLIHDIDICLHLFGAPNEVSAAGWDQPADSVDVITAVLYYESGFCAVISGGWYHPRSFPFVMEYTVTTAGGALDYSSAGRPPTLYRKDGTAEPLPVPDDDAYRNEIAYFVECCRSNEQPEQCPPSDSARAVAFGRLLREARRQNGVKLKCNL